VRSAIVGIGCCTPPESASQLQASTFMQERSALTGTAAGLCAVLHQKSGVDKRHSVVLLETREDSSPLLQDFYTLKSSPQGNGPSTATRMELFSKVAPALGVQAARLALADAKRAPAEITHIITVSCTGFAAPGMDHALITELELADTTERTHVGFMGCHAAINALRVADGLVRSSPDAVVLIVTVELCTLHLQYTSRPDRMLANALFADGAAAALVARPRDGDGRMVMVEATGSCMFPGTSSAMAWEITDNGFAMTLDKSVPVLIRAHLYPWLEKWLSPGTTPIARIKEIGSFAIHPGGPRVLDSVRDALGIDEAKMQPSRDILRQYGNMSSCTVLFILRSLLDARCSGPVLMLAFGPGLTAEGAVLQLEPATLA